MISLTLLTAAGVQILCQLFKVVYYSIRDGSLRRGRLELGYFVSAGGMPSAHAAFATALTVAVALRSGIDSDAFAVSFVFGAIVTYDAFRLRGEVGKHARRINELSPGEKPRLNEMVGHTVAEIVVGIVVGGILSAVVTMLL